MNILRIISVLVVLLIAGLHHEYLRNNAIREALDNDISLEKSIRLENIKNTREELSKSDLSILSISPDFFYLETVDRKYAGIAIKVAEDLYFTPDHVLENHINLFYQGDKIKVQRRDSSQDLLFFTLKNRPLNITSVNFVENLPKLESVVFWKSGEKLIKTSLKSLNSKFTLGDMIKINLLEINGIANFGDSGSPVFTLNGEIIGVLIGSNREKNISYLISSQTINDYIRN